MTTTAHELTVGRYSDLPGRARMYATLLEIFAMYAEEHGFPEGAVPEVIDEPYTPNYFPAGWNTGHRTLGWRYVPPETGV